MQFQEERMAGALGLLKAIDTVLSETLDYCKERKAFGKSILDNQSVYFRLCELATENECLRALTYQAVGKLIDWSTLKLHYNVSYRINKQTVKIGPIRYVC